MVRGAGAAGAQVQLTVEEHALLEPPQEKTSSAKSEISSVDSAQSESTTPVRRTRGRRVRRPLSDDSLIETSHESTSRDSSNDSDEELQPRRRNRRRSALHEREQTFREPAARSRRRSARNPEDQHDALLDDFEVPTSSSRGTARAMTSLLFQEPVLPTQLPSPSRSERSSHSEEDSDSRQTSHEHSTRRRRLNAQERRAAAEVEQIEEDLELDDITYSPIDDESQEPTRTTRRRRRRRSSQNDEDQSQNNTNSAAEEESEEQPVTTRRRRRRRSSEENETEQNNESNKEESSSRSSRSESKDDDEETTTLTRRRRRRRSSSKSSEEETTTRRSRKQQYIDEITDVAGSTRLEAKKQRRRDNRRERNRQNQLLEQDFLARRENVDRLMVVRQRGRHTQISVIEDNVLVEHYVSDIQEVATVGNIYLGRVQNVLPSMEAAFVDIGQARNGVLYAGEVNWDTTRLEGQPRRIEHAFRSGDPVLVQVTKDPIGHKGARLTSQVTLAGRFLVLVPSGGMTGVSRKLSERERSRLKSIVSKVAPKDMGVIIRTAAEGASEDAITKDLQNLLRQWEDISNKLEEFRHGKRPKLLQGEPDVAIRVVRDIFNDDFSHLIVEGDAVYDRIAEYLDTMAPDLKEKLERWDPEEHQGKDVFDKWQIDSQLRKGMERQVYLPSGGSIVIDRTEAMTTIDVNTGRFIGKGRSLEETVTACNLEAAEEIARQLRLRDIGGMVMIDFVDMVMPANRDLVLRRLLECLARDRTKHQVAEVTSLGLVQMTRKRIGQGLVEAFSEECPTCKGRGFIVHDEPTVSADFEDPYAIKGGDPFVKTNKHGHGTEVHAPKGSSAAVKAKLAQIAAAAVAASNDATATADALDDAEHAEQIIEQSEDAE
nr:Rne/Rng family ribonuclease [Bifidobacterium dolichotidis]